MHNWDYPPENMKKNEKLFFERLLTYGLGREKINKAKLKKYFRGLRIPEHTRAFFELLLWKKPY